MKNIIILIALCTVFIPTLAKASGFVSMRNYTDRTVMRGTMNIRYDENSSNNKFVFATGSPGSAVTFGGSNGTQSLACLVSIDNSRYQEAVDAKNNLRNGSLLVISKPQNSNECDTFVVETNSSYQD